MIKKIRFCVSLIAILFLAISVFLPIGSVSAAGLTSQSITLSNPAAAATNDVQTITYTQATTVASGGTITLTYPTGWQTGIGSMLYTDFTLKINGVSQTINEGVPTGTNWGYTVSSPTITFTASGTATVPSAGQVVIITVGATHFITNPSAGNSNIVTITSGASDTGQVTTAIGNNVIAVSATIAQTMSFSVSGSVSLGTLTATSTQTGTSQFQVATNAASGMNVVVTGNTLTSNATGNPTIAACTSFCACSNPTCGNLQGTPTFGLNVVANTYPSVGFAPSGTPPIGLPGMGAYGYSNEYQLHSGDSVAYSTGPINNTTYTVSYIANIPATQTAGIYTTTLTYTAAANF